ncbi:PAS domain-containing protein [Planctomycetales bacterium ZRK34]|nr:PAS domain-containing protein [Planctomycetales bacterium ZRK34]
MSIQSGDQTTPDPHSSPAMHALQIAGLYVLFAVLWILVSDWLAAETGSPAARSLIQTLKGCAFVAVTGLLLYGFCYRLYARQHRIHCRLAEHQRMFATLLEHLPGMAYRCLNDSAWTMQFVSRGCAELTGYDPQMICDSQITYEQIIHPEDRSFVRRTVDDAVAERRPFRMEYRIVTADERTRWVWEQGQPIYDASGVLVAIEGLISDITDRRQAQKLESERNSILRASRAMEQSLGVVGHELRTPLASLRAMSELLLDAEAEFSDQNRQFLQSIHDETDRLAHMASQMLDAARLSSGAVRWRWNTFLLSDHAAVTGHIIRPLIKDAPIEFSSDVNPESLTMNGDPDAVQRLMINLLSNAARHTREGSIRLRLDQTHQGEQRMIRIRVSDTGCGINPQTAEKLGVAFATHQGAPDTSNQRGAGLGLAICRQIVSAHAGSLTVQSTLGRGTTFTALLTADLSEPITDRTPEKITMVPDEQFAD